MVKSRNNSNEKGTVGLLVEEGKKEARVCNNYPKRHKACYFWQATLSRPRRRILGNRSNSWNPRHCDLYSTILFSFWILHTLYINLQLLLLFFLVAEEEEGWMIFGLWQLLWQSSPAHTFSLWYNIQLESAEEESCSSHSCVYTKRPWKTVINRIFLQQLLNQRSCIILQRY